MAYIADSTEYTTLTGQTLSTSSYPRLASFDTLNSTFSHILNGRFGKSTDFTGTQQVAICKMVVAWWIEKLGKSEKADQVYRSPALAAQAFAMEVDPVVDEWVKLISKLDFINNYSSYVS